MAKKKKAATRNDALNELKTLEAKWLRDRRLAVIDPVQAKVCAAKTAALLDFSEQNKLHLDVTLWPLTGIEDLVKMDEDTFKRGLADLQSAGVINSSFRFCKVAAGTERVDEDLAAASGGGLLHYRCAKPGGVNIADRDEYIMEDHEVAYSEDAIAASPNLQTAIANEWLVRIDAPATGEQAEGA
jgi:hypothetical protein